MYVTGFEPGSYVMDVRDRMLKKLGYPVEPCKAETSLSVERVIYSDPATVVFWGDGTKTVVKCQPEDEYEPAIGFLLCVAKKAFGNKGRFNDVLRMYVPVWPES